MKAFAYVNPTNEKDAVAALKTDGIAMPLGGGQDLLARMKDYIDAPDRVVNVKNALDTTITGDAGRRAEDRRGDEDRRPRRARAGREAVSRDQRRGDRSRHAADPQSRHRGRQRQPAAALLVLPQRRVRLLQEGRLALLSPCRAKTSSTRSSATRARATSCIRRAWRCRSSPTARSSASSGPSGERDVPAADYFTLPTIQNVLKENVLADDELLTHVMLPAPGNVKSGHYEVRYKQSHDWPLAFTTVVLTMSGNTIRIGAGRARRGGAGAVALAGCRARAGGQAAERADRGAGGRGGRACGEAAERQRLQDSDCEDGREARDHECGRNQDCLSVVLEVRRAAGAAVRSWNFSTQHRRHGRILWII